MIPFYFFHQGGSLDVKQLSRLFLDTVGFFQGLVNKGPFEFIHS